MTVSRTGRIELPNGVAFDCELKRQTASGASIRLTEPTTLPQRFELREGDIIRPVTVIWRASTTIGVRFDDYFRRRERTA